MTAIACRPPGPEPMIFEVSSSKPWESELGLAAIANNYGSASRSDTVMGRSLSIQDRLDEVLEALPVEIGTGHHGAQRLVVSTGGVFVLDTSVDDSDTRSVTTGRLAAMTRDLLAEKLRWVPFVDWFVVTDDEPTASRLPVDLVGATVREGHSVDRATVRRIQALLDFGELTPPWRPGIPNRMDPDDHTPSEEPSDLPAH